MLRKKKKINRKPKIQIKMKGDKREKREIYTDIKYNNRIIGIQHCPIFFQTMLDELNKR